MPNTPRRRARATTLLLALLLLAAIPITTRAAELTVYRSRFYEIHSDLPRQEVLPFGAHMDRVFAEYQQRFSRFSARQSGSMPLYLFRTKEDYLAFMQKRGIQAENSGGMFFSLGGDQGLVTWTQGKSRSETFEVLQHEGFHQFAFNHLGTDLPIWANEGLAQYFEDAILVGHRTVVGLANADRLERIRQALDQNKAPSVESLLSLTPQLWARHLQTDPTRAALNYAQAWSLAHFFIHADDGRYRNAFGNYLSLISQGRRSGDAFRQAFGIENGAPIQSRWERYIRQLEPDPVTAAEEDLVFLGVALEWLQEQKIGAPKDLDEVKRLLHERRFRVTRSTHGVVTEYDSADEELFRYDLARDHALPYEILRPTASGLPPRVRAPRLEPMPTLVWSRNEAGELVMDVEYK